LQGVVERISSEEDSSDISRAQALHWTTVIGSIKDIFELTLDESCGEVAARCSKFFVRQAEVVEKRGSISGGSSMSGLNRSFSLWCFSPAVSLSQFVMGLGVHSLIVTSGTLSPVAQVATQLGGSSLKFNVQLENKHVISPKQLCAMTLSRGPQGHSLKSNFQNRNNPSYIRDLGDAISEVCRSVTGGVLVFFTSYGQLNYCYKSWQEGGVNSVLHRIQLSKKVLVEPKTDSELKAVLLDYCSTAKQATARERNNGTDLASSTCLTGALLMGVCRGKISEGIDLADWYCRVVIVAGVPYPSWMDPRVQLKMRFLDQFPSSVCRYGQTAGREWYNQQASKAVNQAIGRIARHVMDFGIIVLADERFSFSQQKSELSGWVREALVNIGDPRSQ